MRLVAFFLLAALAATAQQPFTFAIVGDPQIGMTGLEADRQNYARAASAVNAAAPAFVVLMGDLVNDAANPAHKAAADAVRKTFTMPVYAVTGNHDAPAERARWAFEHGGCLFIGLDSNVWGRPGAADEQFRWLEQQLKARKGRAFVFQHHPLYVTGPGEKDEYFNTPSTWRGKLLDLFASSGVTAVMSGHLHRNASGVLRGVGMLITPSVVKNLDGSPLGYRLVRVFPEGYQETYMALP